MNGPDAPRTVIPDSDDICADLDWRRQLEAVAAHDTTQGDGHVNEEPGNVQVEDVAKIKSETAAETSIEGTAQITPTKPSDRKEKEKPTKTMRLKGGKLASPVATTQESPKTPKRGRKPKSAQSPTLIVRLDYASRSSNPQETGRRIQGILDGQITHQLPAPQPQPAKKPAPVAMGPPKATHPFFTGKARKLDHDGAKSNADNHDEPPKPSPRKLSVTTPGKLRTQRDAFRMPGSPSPKRNAPIQRPKLKHLGEHPAWPNKENAHVRGLDDAVHIPQIDIRAAGFLDKSSKRKQELDFVDEKDGILCTLTKQLQTEHRSLREPTKVITTGEGLQVAVTEHLSAGAPDASSHLALQRMYQGISQELSPFDRYECETQSWTHKYSPKFAADVLQIGQEAHVLKDWLQRRTITAVQTSSKRSTASSTVSTSKAKKKRKRKDDDEDNFIVGTDDELDELNELLPLSDPTRPQGALRSIVRGGDEYKQSIPASTVLLSGPHGCGKTAAVYAVAKELGFEIFEINSASRRSGKDVLDKIGDMTENHLVQQVSKALTEDKPVLATNGKMEAIKIDEPDAPDPKQKSMASFFKAQPAAKKSTTNAIKMQKTIAKSKQEGAKPQGRKKQSLILLEEVDVLFEEDKQFWLTILTLAAHSRRPIIMTCNDERYVPEALEFHAILRFVAPSLDLASDYLLLLAAREGHVLERHAVQSLYKTKGMDLRGSVVELDFWCQMAVGDTTRGFNWMLDRYPPGIDVDEHGRTLRIASKNTFVAGMNVVSHDVAMLGRNTIEELWSQAGDDWQVEKVSEDVLPEGYGNAASLDDLANTMDMLSMADISCGFDMRTPFGHPIDATAPPLREKTIASYVLGWTGYPNPLQADPVTDFSGLDKHLAVSCQLGAIQSVRPQSTPSADILQAVQRKTTSPPSRLNRNDFSHALDIFAADPEDPSTSSTTITASSFDREFCIIATDLAPYIRSIAREYRLREEERIRMSNLLIAGGKRRQTRNAFAAMDGGRRSDRRARYFEVWRKMGVDVKDVLGTAGEEWMSQSAVEDNQTGTGCASVAGDVEMNLGSSQDTDELH